MHSNFTNQHQISALSYNPAIQQKLQLQDKQYNQVDFPETAIIQGGGILAFIFFWSGLLMIMSKMVKGRLDNHFTVPTNRLQNHRCTRCQYFSKNHFLNCAVQPAIVLTEEAEKCLDFCAQTNHNINHL